MIPWETFSLQWRYDSTLLELELRTTDEDSSCTLLIFFWLSIATQQTFTCLKSVIETLGKGVKYVIDVFLVFLLLTLNIFYTLYCSILDFEQVNVSWVRLWMSAHKSYHEIRHIDIMKFGLVPPFLLTSAIPYYSSILDGIYF